MFVVLPNADRIHSSFWVSPRADWLLGAWLSPWSLLHRLLLGFDGALVCRWRHESLLDRCPCGIGVGRKTGAWSACPANCRDCLCSERGLVADSVCLIRYPLMAQSGHAPLHRTCPLLGVKRRWPFAGIRLRSLLSKTFGGKRTFPNASGQARRMDCSPMCCVSRRGLSWALRHY